MLSISFSRLSQKPRQATGEDSAEAEPTEAKPSGQPPKPSADRKSSEERTERPRKQSGLPLEYCLPSPQWILTRGRKSSRTCEKPSSNSRRRGRKRNNS